MQKRISYNLFTEPWVEVLNGNGKEERLGLKELFTRAGELRRLNFDRPGYDLAVLRLLIALVYLVEPPEGRREWHGMYRAGCFSESFMRRLDKYESLFDLLGDKKAFLQRGGVKTGSKPNISSVTELLKWVPGKSASVHFMHGTYGYDNFPLCPACVTPALLSAQVFANSGGVAPKEGGESRHYLAGLNGASPVYVYLQDNDLYGTILLNVLNDSALEQYRELGEMGENCGWSGERWENFLLNASDIGIVEGLLWQPRGVTLFAEDNVDNRACSLCNSISEKVISSLDFRSGNYKVEGYWNDPMVSRIDNNGEISRASLSGPERAERAGWRDYVTFLYTEKRVVESKKAEKIFTRFIPPLVQQSGILKEGKRQINLFSFIVDTPSQPQIKKVLNSSYDFSANWLEDEEIKKGLSAVVGWTDKGEQALGGALKAALNESKVTFATAYWRGLEADFKELLHCLAEESEYFNIEKRWKAVLMSHLRQQYNLLTHHLISNASLLQGVEKGRSKLESFIYKNLIEKGEDE